MVSQRTHKIFFDTRSCIGELSLKQAQLSYAFNVATNGKIPPSEYKKILKPNGEVSLTELLNVVHQLNQNGTLTGFPRRINEPYIQGNVASFNLDKHLKLVKSIEFINISIPRDIIPMYVYFPGFIDNCIPLKHTATTKSFINSLNEGNNSTWETPINAEINDFIDPTI